MTADERRAIAAIDLERLVATLCDLIALESTGGRETPAQERTAQLMREAGMDVDVWDLDLDALRREPAYSAEIDRDHALGVVGRWGGGTGPALVLNGHIDVVPAGDLDRWTVPPWEGTVRDGRVYGRGAVDMKGGLACAIAAVQAIRHADLALAGSVHLQSVVGEEDGGLGTLGAIRRGHTGDAAIVLEPTRLVIAPAHAGALNFRLTVPGRAAHGALRLDGIDPIEKFMVLYRAMRDLERRRNARPRHPLFAGDDLPYPLCVGTVRAGTWASSVAESLVCAGRLGVAVDEAPDMARAELVAAIAEAAARDPWLADHPPTLEWWGGQFAPALTDATEPIVETVRSALRDVVGREPATHGMPYGADMRLLVNEAGIPALLFGPGDIRAAHAPDEFVPILDLEAATRTLVLTILRFCRTQSR